MTTAGVLHHVQLAKHDGTTPQGLTLAVQDAEYLYRARKFPDLPTEDLEVGQTSWHHGFGQYLYDPRDPYRYAWSDGIDLRHAATAQLIHKSSPQVGFLLRNPDAEDESTNGWGRSDSGVTLSNQAGAANTGARGFRMVTTGVGSGAILMRQTLKNPTVFRSRAIRIGCYLRRTGGSDSGVELHLNTLSATGSVAKVCQTGTSSGTPAWSNPTRIQSNNDSVASIGSLSQGQTSGYLVAENFGFTISGDIAGIEVTAEVSASGGDRVEDVDVQLLKAGSTHGEAKKLAAKWPASLTERTYGSSSDLWGGTWSDANINHAEFGVQIRCKCVAGSAAACNVDYISITIYSATVSLDTVVSSAVTSSSFTHAIVAETSLSSSTELIRIELRTTGNESNAHTYEADDFYVMPTGGVEPTAMARYADALYLAIGRFVCVFDETEDRFDAVLIDETEEFTSLAVHGDHIYAAHGTGYNSSNDQSTPRSAWSGDIDPDNGEADFLVSAVDQLGVRRLFRASKPNTLYISSETFNTAIGAGNWNATAYTVGETDKEFTGLYNAFETVLVGREDGLFYFYPPDNAFRAATEHLVISPDRDNFDRGIEFVDGWFYTTTARYGLVRLQFSGGDIIFDQMAARFAGPMYDDFGGRIRGFGHDGDTLWALQDTPVPDRTATKTVNLIAGRNEDMGGGRVQFAWHTQRTWDIGVVGGVFVDANFVFGFGEIFNTDATAYEAALWRLKLPTQHRNMMKEDPTIRAVEETGTKVFVTPIFDFEREGYGAHDKGWTKVVVQAENLNANRTITVEEQRDDSISDGGSWTAVGSALTSVTNGTSTVSFTAGTSGKRLRLRFTEVTNVSTDGPIMRGYTIFAMPHPDRYWTWDLTAKLATAGSLLPGQRSSNTAENILANLQTLSDEDYPLKFNDVDGTQYNATILGFEKLVLPAPSVKGEARAEHMELAVRLFLREVLTS